MTDEVIIGMDPHKSSNTIAVLTRDETMLLRRRFVNSDEGLLEMLDAVAEFPNRVWACCRIGAKNLLVYAPKQCVVCTGCCAS